MLVTNNDILTALNTITGIQSYYELFADSQCKKPCITYIETNNQQSLTSETFGYSNIGYNIKLWVDDYADIATYAPKIDKVIRGLGFYRQGSNELVVGNQICKIFNYAALGIENFN